MLRGADHMMGAEVARQRTTVSWPFGWRIISVSPFGAWRAKGAICTPLFECKEDDPDDQQGGGAAGRGEFIISKSIVEGPPWTIWDQQCRPPPPPLGTQPAPHLGLMPPPAAPMGTKPAPHLG